MDRLQRAVSKIEKIAGAAESESKKPESKKPESKKAMYQARDDRNGALVLVREAIHAMSCRDIGDLEYLRVQQELIRLCSRACDLSHAYREALEMAAQVRAVSAQREPRAGSEGSPLPLSRLATDG